MSSALYNALCLCLCLYYLPGDRCGSFLPQSVQFQMDVYVELCAARDILCDSDLVWPLALTGLHTVQWDELPSPYMHSTTGALQSATCRRMQPAEIGSDSHRWPRDSLPCCSPERISRWGSMLLNIHINT